MPKRISVSLLLGLLLAFFSTSAFAQSEKKTAYAILLDNTRSLEKQFPQVIIIGEGIASRVRERGPVSLFNFITKRDEDAFVDLYGEDAHEGGNHDLAVAAVGVEWSQDDNVLGQYIGGLSVVRGNTSLFEAVHSMAEALNKKVGAEKEAFGDKVIILITDGEHRVKHSLGGPTVTRHIPTDDEDEWKEQEGRVISELKQSGIKVYAVGLIRELNAYGGLGHMSTKEKAESFLKKITRETGGRVVFPNSKKIDIEALLAELLGK